MSVVLLAIKFNHDPSSATTDALNVRRNGARVVHVPEWQRGISVNPADSVAAYAIRETLGRTLTVRAKFARTDAALQTVEVRAVPPAAAAPPAPPELLQLLLSPLLYWQPLAYYYLLSLYLSQQAAAPPGNVLGEVRPRAVTFGADGETDFELCELQNVSLGRRGVGINNIQWDWQYRVGPGAPWQEIATTRHKIYTLLETPRAPWQQLPFARGNTQLPWTDVLDYACRWAAGARTPTEAATHVTREVFELGASIIEYGCPVGASTQYSLLYFDCTSFLDRLRGGFGNGQYVNCSDCATIVSTFANALGCDLWQSRMAPLVGDLFLTNPVISIGGRTVQTPCGFLGFAYHEVAWERGATSRDAVYDACLLLNGAPDPTRAPFVPLLPANIIFGQPGSRQYLDRLSPPQGRANCVPQPQARQRRFVA